MTLKDSGVGNLSLWAELQVYIWSSTLCGRRGNPKLDYVQLMRSEIWGGRLSRWLESKSEKKKKKKERILEQRHIYKHIGMGIKLFILCVMCYHPQNRIYHRKEWNNQKEDKTWPGDIVKLLSFDLSPYLQYWCNEHMNEVAVVVGMGQQHAI